MIAGYGVIGDFGILAFIPTGAFGPDACPWLEFGVGDAPPVSFVPPPGGCSALRACAFIGGA